MLPVRVGRRGKILLILAVIDVAYGLSLIAPPADPSSAATRWREIFLPLWVWGALWLVVAAILAVSAFMRHDAFGYSAAIGIKVIWALTTLVSWAFGGVPRGWVAAIIWLTFAEMVWIIAGWPEPYEPDLSTKRTHG